MSIEAASKVSFLMSKIRRACGGMAAFALRSFRDVEDILTHYGTVLYESLDSKDLRTKYTKMGY